MTAKLLSAEELEEIFDAMPQEYLPALVTHIAALEAKLAEAERERDEEIMLRFQRERA